VGGVKIRAKVSPLFWNKGEMELRGFDRDSREKKSMESPHPASSTDVITQRHLMLKTGFATH